MAIMIVKVQITLFSSSGVPEVLVYNKNREHEYSGEASQEIIETMNGEPKKFFYANVPKKAGFITINEEAPWQDW